MELIYFLASAQRVFVDTHDLLLQKNVQYQNYLAHQLEQEITLK
jgi:hypothetical protein